MKASFSLTSFMAALWLALFSMSTFAQEAQRETEKAATESEADAFDLQSFMEEYRTLLMQRKFDEAEEKFDQALQKTANSPQVRAMHPLAYSFLRRAGRNEEAFEHLKAAADYELEMAAEGGRSSENFSRYLSVLADMAAELGGTERALAVLDEYGKRAEELSGESDEIQRSIETQRALQLAKAGRADEATAIIDEQVSAAEAKLQENPGNADAILAKASALSNRVQLQHATEGGDAHQASSELLEFLSTQAKEHPDSPAVVQRFATEHISRAAQLARSEPDKAEALVEKVENFGKSDSDTETDDAETDDAETQADEGAGPLAIYQSSIARLRQQIEQSRKMLALIGSPAVYPENVDGWVNGESLTPEALRGKVVLLDFFAIWCGPCIATFPHLQEWHEEYADKGLQIIGITNYYKYGWDEEAGRSKQEPNIEPEAERAAMEHFVKHHELHHPIAFVNDRSLQEHYAVSGIPHAVVIDRQGKVRLFRIGSGEANAADLKKAIEESLAESPPSG